MARFAGRRREFQQLDQTLRDPPGHELPRAVESAPSPPSHLRPA